jgi:hypothetical protein
MAYVDWSIKGPELSTCNCDWGCPCQFNALPTQGYCHAAVAMRIDEGYFGEVRLDGLHWVSLLAWPGPIHYGSGACLAIVDERADERQRGAILTILAGKETAPAATIFNALAATLTEVHKPQFRPILFAADIEARTGHFSVPGLVEARGEPILNPVTKSPARARVTLPHGFEYIEAEYGNSVTTARGPITFGWPRGHAHFAMLHLTPTGPVR